VCARVLYKQQSPDPKPCFIVYSSRAHARPPTATAFVATAPRVALIFVARIVNIVSCNKNYFFHGLPSTLLQLFYFRQCIGPCHLSGNFLTFNSRYPRRMGSPYQKNFCNEKNHITSFDFDGTFVDATFVTRKFTQPRSLLCPKKFVGQLDQILHK
jgi:hypothetical protein